jgi:hypothetical protein
MILRYQRNIIVMRICMQRLINRTINNDLFIVGHNEYLCQSYKPGRSSRPGFLLFVDPMIPKLIFIATNMT